MQNTVIIKFKNVISELEEKEMKLCFLQNRGMFLEDRQKNLYQINPHNGMTYLDKLIKEGVSLEFKLIDKAISENIEEWERETWDSTEVKKFMLRQKLV